MRSTPTPSQWIIFKLGIRPMRLSRTHVTGVTNSTSASPAAASHSASVPPRSQNTSSAAFRTSLPAAKVSYRSSGANTNTFMPHAFFSVFFASP